MSSVKQWKSKLSRISKFLLIFLLIAGWLFSGWPQIWPRRKALGFLRGKQNPPAPLDKYLMGAIHSIDLSPVLFLTGVFVFATLWILTPPALTFVGAGFVFVLK